MGAGASSALPEGVLRHTVEQFRQCISAPAGKGSKGPRTKAGKQLATLAQILQMQPVANLRVSLDNIPTLFLIDSSRDGLFSEQEVVAFATLCSRLQPLYHRVEFPQQLKGFALLRLASWVKSTPDSKQQFEDWFVKLFTEGRLATTKKEAAPDVHFLKLSAVQLMHSVLDIEAFYGYDLQSFMDLLQRLGEDKELMRLEFESLDDVVPCSVVATFAGHWLDGVLSSLQTLRFEDVATP